MRKRHVYDDFVRYLEAKQSVDDRSLAQGVAVAAERYLRERLPNVRIFEVGAGHGATIERFASRGLLDAAQYTAVESDAETAAIARRRFAHDGRIGSLDVLAVDVFDLARSNEHIARSDLVVAHAVLDLLDIDRALPLLQELCVPGGAFYFTINFDGGTIFEPMVDPSLDADIVAAYHQTMDQRVVRGRRAGHSQTGRRLFRALARRAAVIEVVGSSDWVVWPRDGAYPNDEAYFLHFIVATVERALADAGFEAGRLRTWVSTRHTQIERGELVYLAHQLDFFGHWP